MTPDFLRVNQILTDTYGVPRGLQFIYPHRPDAPATLNKNFAGNSWLDVHNTLCVLWNTVRRKGEIYIVSTEEPPQFTPRRFRKYHDIDKAPSLSMFFAEMMVNSPDEVKVPSTEEWEDLL